jgi:hypothetical protein
MSYEELICEPGAEYRRMSVEQNKEIKADPYVAEVRASVAKMYREVRRLSPKLARKNFVMQRAAIRSSVASVTENLFSCGTCDETRGLGALLRDD